MGEAFRRHYPTRPWCCYTGCETGATTPNNPKERISLAGDLHNQADRRHSDGTDQMSRLTTLGEDDVDLQQELCDIKNVLYHMSQDGAHGVSPSGSSVSQKQGEANVVLEEWINIAATAQQLAQKGNTSGRPKSTLNTKDITSAVKNIEKSPQQSRKTSSQQRWSDESIALPKKPVEKLKFKSINDFDHNSEMYERYVIRVICPGMWVRWWWEGSWKSVKKGDEGLVLSVRGEWTKVKWCARFGAGERVVQVPCAHLELVGLVVE